MENRYSSGRLHAHLRNQNVQARAGGNAECLAVFGQHRHTASFHTRSRTNPLRTDAWSVAHSWRRLGATGDGVTVGLRHDRLPTHFDPWIGSYRLSLAHVHALDRSAHMKNG